MKEERFGIVAVLLVLTLGSTARAQESFPPSELVLVGGTVLASPQADPIRDGVVVIENGVVAAVGARGTVQVPENARRLEIEGHTVTAGFWNTHVHLGGWLPRVDTLPDDALAEMLAMGLLRWGFVRALETHTSDLGVTREIQRRVAEGSVEGPSILTTGTAFDPAGGDHIGLGLPEIATREDARSKVASRVGQGVAAIKIMTGSLTADSVVTMSEEVARAAVETAHAAGLRVLAHPSNETGARVAIEAGVDALAHVFATGVGPDWDRSLVERMIERDIALVPTLGIFGSSSVARSQLREFHEAGGRVLFGTDLGYLTEPDPNSEYWLMRESGMDAREILASLTTGPASFFGMGDEVGRIEPGLDADLVVLADDPLKNLSALAQVRYVIRRGRIVHTGEPWDPEAWERGIGRPYVSLVRGIPMVPVAEEELDVVELTVEEMRDYEGTYRWGRKKVRIWVEDGLLRVTPPEGLDVEHLIPLEDGEFVQGRYRDGRPAEIYWPGTGLRSLVEGEEVVGFVVDNGAWSGGRIERVE